MPHALTDDHFVEETAAGPSASADVRSRAAPLRRDRRKIGDAVPAAAKLSDPRDCRADCCSKS